MGEGGYIVGPALAGHIATAEQPLLVCWMSDVGGFSRPVALEDHQDMGRMLWMSGFEDFLLHFVANGD